MGMFDTVYCEYPLPDARHQDLDFQTKNLECALDTYTITRDGRLVRRAGSGWGANLDRDVEWSLHGDIRIYTSVKSEDPSWVEYVVRFTHGRVQWIRPLEEVQKDPDLPSPDLDLSLEPYTTPKTAEVEAQPRPANSEAGEGAAPSDEGALLLSLRRERPELEKLLAECSDHWGYEDSVYRFYNQSFKVYGLQGRTQAIVQRLQALAPDRPLNPWFVQIVQAGTGKVFKPEDNARWMEATRPILEAFFHARFFLEMAVRYADLQEPPQMLPSGYAALLYLFGLR
jgi:hypothetical protein